jgi:2'-5' RNA ligase
MRLFYAIDISLKIKKQLASQLKEIQKEYPEFRWIPLENYHITLHFIGEVSNKQKKEIIKKTKDILFDQEEFYLYSFNLALFMHNRILMYVTFHREKKIEQLVETLKKIFAPNDKINKFIPHLTFARYRIPSRQQYLLLKKRLKKTKVEISFLVKKITLFNSVDNGKFPEYKKVKSFSLQKRKSEGF